MEQQWEHKIADEYKAKDAKTSYSKKEELWTRISSSMPNSKGLAAFWKVAAILLALVMFGGVFAAISVWNSQNEELIAFENKYEKLQLVVDSLMNMEPVKITEIQVLEKEKIIYKEVIVIVEKETKNGTKNIKLTAEVEKLNEQLFTSKQNHQLTKDSLLIAHLEIKNQKKLEENILEEKKLNFKLKPEKVIDQMQQNLQESTPKMKLQLFKLQDTNVKFDTNSTLLNK